MTNMHQATDKKIQFYLSYFNTFLEKSINAPRLKTPTQTSRLSPPSNLNQQYPQFLPHSIPQLSCSSTFIESQEINIVIKFKMDSDMPSKQRSLYEERLESSMTPESSYNFSKEKSTRKSKKDSLRQKKKLKNSERQINIDHDQMNDQILLKNKSDQDNSATTYESAHLKTKTTPPLSISKPNINLNTLLNKPPYVTISNSARISGDFGHSSGIFKRPIIEGVYFLELAFKQDCKKDKNLQYKSAVRVGICHHAYNCSFPLGCDQSAAYKSSDGIIIRNGQKIGEAQPYAPGDVIGMLLNISPPHKFPKQKEINQGSTISFFKNGKMVFELKELKQVFYCFGVSFFNYSQIEVLLGPNSRYPMPLQAKSYFTVLNQQILYKDLKNNKIFKI